jgi:hypothetical protein
MSAAQQLAIATRGFRTLEASVDQIAISTRGYRLGLQVVTPTVDYRISAQAFCIDYASLLHSQAVSLVTDTQYLNYLIQNIEKNVSAKNIDVSTSPTNFKISTAYTNNIVNLFTTENSTKETQEIVVTLTKGNEIMLDLQDSMDLGNIPCNGNEESVALTTDSIVFTYNIDLYKLTEAKPEEINLEYPNILEVPIGLVTKYSPC